MFVGKDDGGSGAPDNDGGGFVRIAAWWCFALSTIFYVCLLFAAFTFDMFIPKRFLLALFGLIVYVPAIAIWAVARWFLSRDA